MKRYTFTPVARLLIVLASVSSCGVVLRAEDPKRVKDFTNVPLKDLDIEAVTPRKEAATGFTIGGKNATALVQGLKEINGRTIADLEKDMRPGANSEVGSDKGFLGKDEKLLDVLAADNKYVVDERGLTHPELARHLHALGAIGLQMNGAEFLYHGRRFKVAVSVSKGYQLSPFYDGTKTNVYAEVHNLDNGKKLELSLLVPHMIERYGFYEGQGTPYRVPPSAVLEVLDFLKQKKDKP